MEPRKPRPTTFFQDTKNPQSSGHFPISWPSKYNKNEALKTYETDFLTGDNDNFKAHKGLLSGQRKGSLRPKNTLGEYFCFNSARSSGFQDKSAYFSTFRDKLQIPVWVGGLNVCSWTQNVNKITKSQSCHNMWSDGQSTVVKLWSGCHRQLADADTKICGCCPPRSVCRLPSRSSSQSANPVAPLQWCHSDSASATTASGKEPISTTIANNANLHWYVEKNQLLAIISSKTNLYKYVTNS